MFSGSNAPGRIWNLAPMGAAVAETIDHGFDWGSAVAGAGVGAGSVLLLVAVGAAVRGRRTRSAVTHQQGGNMHLISRRFGLLAVALVALGAYATTVWATPGNISLANSWKGTFSDLDVQIPGQIKLKAKDATDVHVVRNAFIPRSDTVPTTGWHTHPGPSLIIVTAGTIAAYEPTESGCVRREYTANTANNTLIDPGDGSIHVLRNETSAPAETVAIQFLPQGADRRIDEPSAPEQCP